MKTCIEINKMMTDLIQQINDLNNEKVGLFCKLCEEPENFDVIDEELKTLNDELLQKQSLLYAMIVSEIDYVQRYQAYHRADKEQEEDNDNRAS